MPRLRGTWGRTAGLVLIAGACLPATARPMQASPQSPPAVRLPKPHASGAIAVEKALASRRSLREFAPGRPLTQAELGQLLWSAQGVTGAGGLRTAPSAGALYPLELHVIAGNVAGLPPGVYRYVAAEHALARTTEGDRRSALASAALGQSWLASAPAVVLVAAVPERTARKYGPRAERYVHFEAGCAAENLALQATALGLGTTVVGAFDDAAVASLAGLAPGERPLALLPVGRPARAGP